VLAIPPGGKWRSPERILITWKDSRESRRAVRDALPFLRRARKVGLVEIVEHEETSKLAQARLRDVASWLKSHSVEALPQAITPRGDALDAFAGAAREFKPDWIVAGAYGHTRLGEWIFGGVTRYLLTQSGRPAFLSH
jgi:nucleotide-binding universal stress UspA family protein